MRWFKKPGGEPLAVSMSGIKLGDRLLVIGSDDTSLTAALAVKVGLTGRACIVATSEAERARAADAVEREGALVESFVAAAGTLPFDDGSFDVVVMRNALEALAPGARHTATADALRVLRPGGRCLVIDGTRRSGIGGLIGGGGAGSDPTPLMTAAGFRGVRRLAEREGLAFTEGVKPGPGGGVAIS